jgi:hypothetical protein
LEFDEFLSSNSTKEFIKGQGHKINKIALSQYVYQTKAYDVCVSGGR